MNKKPNRKKTISRRGILPFIGSTLLIPFLGFGRSGQHSGVGPEEDIYETLLRPDGTTVKVKTSTVRKSKIVKKNISNTTFLRWLGKENDSL
ncbi:hypothetical protein FK220_009910 [Flavobacteriaceae bacterium TP-CH-4]|uniref:Uncharacterized protein n=1 Tax=Pelagihabitans pacificus TaxID=2696054 RepID=A0A967EAQ6_9FLAO|nr:hypothetical protein [Pelagihabitans pacificus]NHF59656.1 hypothetical protein [Pelagihabitans pacificus]